MYVLGFIYADSGISARCLTKAGVREDEVVFGP